MRIVPCPSGDPTLPYSDDTDEERTRPNVMLIMSEDDGDPLREPTFEGKSWECFRCSGP